jgi:hypothetical protein
LGIVHCLSSAFAVAELLAPLLESVALVHAVMKADINVATMSSRGSLFISSLLMFDCGALPVWQL